MKMLSWAALQVLLMTLQTIIMIVAIVIQIKK